MLTVYAQALRRAALRLGGEQELRAYLRVSMNELHKWLRGEERPPTHIFLKVVDVISAEPGVAQADPLRRSRELRRQSEILASAAREVRDRATGSIERAFQVREALAAHRRHVSVDQFCATEYARSEERAIVESALNAVLTGTQAHRANMQVAVPEGLRIIGHIGFKQPFLDFFAVVGHDTPSTCGRAAELGRPVVVTDVASDPIFAGTQAGAVMQQAGALACVSTPLLGASGALLGMLSVHYESAHIPDKEELVTLDRVAGHASHWLADAPA